MTAAEVNAVRPKVAHALAKALAFKACGKDEQASEWAAVLVRLLECTDILNPQNRIG